MQIEDLPLPGLKRIRLKHVRDRRGEFVKNFHADMFQAAGIDHVIREEFYSRSARGVVRGMHFQRPPHDHTELVFCPAGRVIDVVVDLRRSSPTYGRYHAEILHGEEPCALFIPRGLAHGFQALEEGSMVFYSVSTVHHPESDAGIRWDSFGFTWPEPVAGLSDRDRAHPPLQGWESPFL
jgi:dTDP-4-dehydrorhamnose 3,5-epimerase